MTDEMQQARYALQTLSIADPTGRSNMLLHLAALKLMLTGRRGPDIHDGEPILQAGFQLVRGEDRLLMAVAARTGAEQVYMAFDVDDAAGVPIGLGVVRPEGERVVFHPSCKPWSAPGEGRTVLARIEDGACPGHFVFRRGQPMRHVDGPPPGDLLAGLRRAQARQLRLVASPELQDVQRQGFRTIFSNDGREVFADVEAVGG